MRDDKKTEHSLIIIRSRVGTNYPLGPKIQPNMLLLRSWSSDETELSLWSTAEPVPVWSQGTALPVST